MTEGRIYTMYQNADPGMGWQMDDPIFTKKGATLGACVPNIRRAVKLGDYMFVISGKYAGVQQYVIGAFRVDEKINALAAYKRFPENRKIKRGDGTIGGNVIIDSKGNQHKLDNHTNYERRLENYLIGKNPVLLDKPSEIERSRQETLPFLSDLFGKSGNRVFDIIGRQRKLNEEQVNKMLKWLEDIKS